jgi:hypothetical protein
MINHHFFFAFFWADDESCDLARPEAALDRRLLWRVQLEVNLPVLRPSRQQKDAFSDDGSGCQSQPANPHVAEARRVAVVLSSELPSLAIPGVNISVGRLVVGELRLLVVPGKLLAGEANGNGPD